MSSRAQARFDALKIAAGRRAQRFDRKVGRDGRPMKVSEYYGCNTFGYELMEKKLKSAEVEALRNAAATGETLSVELADKVAQAVKEWSIGHGATHYCHWFQPQTGSTAEKHDAFFSLTSKVGAVEKFTGAELVRSEPDASSFPSGGARSTFEARGYTVWDASSPMFLMEAENGLTLCIPSLFISYGGEALDKKTPLLRSLSAVNHHATEALRLIGHDSAHVLVTAGPEQEYFVVDEAFYALRPDLILTGRTLVGAAPPRHQQMEDHYFGSMKPRVLNFIMECEHELYKLGVPSKTRHNEVAPSQCETAPIFEQANLATDHNQLVMEIIKLVAKRHGLVALFHEKPFAGMNGSGKHVNWSLADASGHNLLEPGDKPHENIRFLYFLSAAVKAIHDFGGLMRLSVATPGNDFRLGANEAPPAIMSVFLGETLTEVMNRLANGETAALKERSSKINLDLARVPVIERDNTDRNRTSPFAFTGNKFEFRAVGASDSISPALAFLNAAVAKSLKSMNDTLRSRGGDKPTTEDVLAVIQETVKATEKVRFEGNNYSEAWHKEAAGRGLPNFQNTVSALAALRDERVINMLSELKILSKTEIEGRYNVRLERYVKTRLIELETLHDLISTAVFPALLATQRSLSSALQGTKEVLGQVPLHEKARLTEIAELGETLLSLSAKMQALIITSHKDAEDKPLEVAERLADEGMLLLERGRSLASTVESMVDDADWSLPKFRELLYVH